MDRSGSQGTVGLEQPLTRHLLESPILTQALGNRVRKHIETLFEWAMPACLRFVRKEVKEISPTEDSGLARRWVLLLGVLLCGNVTEGTAKTKLTAFSSPQYL